VGITAAKWAILAAALATVGFGCSVEIIKDDGEIVNVVTEDETNKAKDTATNFVDQVKDAATSFISQIKETEEPAQDADFEQVVDESQPKD
jgi:ABC-type xylose transport system substrate-binding protein